MFKYPRFAVAFTSFFLLIFALFGPVHLSFMAAWAMFSLSPFLVIWMVVSVLKDPSGNTPELANDEHWGYVDRPDLRAGQP